MQFYCDLFICFVVCCIFAVVFLLSCCCIYVFDLILMGTVIGKFPSLDLGVIFGKQCVIGPLYVPFSHLTLHFRWGHLNDPPGPKNFFQENFPLSPSLWQWRMHDLEWRPFGVSRKISPNCIKMKKFAPKCSWIQTGFTNEPLIFSTNWWCYIFAIVKCTYISTESSHIIKIH